MNAKPVSVVPIVVTAHARARARERCPGFKAARIVDEVRAALREGRVSAYKHPDFRGPTYEDCLYAWSDDRVYALKAADNALVVVTTVTRKQQHPPKRVL